MVQLHLGAPHYQALTNAASPPLHVSSINSSIVRFSVSGCFTVSHAAFFEHLSEATHRHDSHDKPPSDMPGSAPEAQISNFSCGARTRFVDGDNGFGWKQPVQAVGLGVNEELRGDRWISGRGCA